MNTLAATEQKETMSSIDLLNVINKYRLEDGKGEMRHSDFLKKIEDELEGDERNFSSVYIGGNNESRKMYELPKDECMLMAMRESKYVRKQTVAYIKTLESKSALPNFSDPVEAARAWADEVERKKAVEHQLELQAPKVAFVDNCVERGQLMTATQIAQKHKMSAVKLNKFLDEVGGVYSKTVKRSRVFLMSFVDNGLGEMKQTELGYSQCLFTAKGEQWINEQLITEGIV